MMAHSFSEEAHIECFVLGKLNVNLPFQHVPAVI